MDVSSEFGKFVTEEFSRVMSRFGVGRARKICELGGAAEIVAFSNLSELACGVTGAEVWRIFEWSAATERLGGLLEVGSNCAVS